MILRCGPMAIDVDTDLPEVVAALEVYYGPDAILSKRDFADFFVELRRPAGLRRWYRPQVIFALDGEQLFKPLPRDQAMQAFEWGLNWIIEHHCHQYLIVHAAVIEKGGHAILMPGQPGSGKSTLAAAMTNRGWRLLSDEIALISMADGALSALARPISLKNESIPVLRRFVPDAIIGCEARDTVKGTVALMRAPLDSIARIAQTARASWIIFPRYLNGLPVEIRRRSRASTLMSIIEHSFNYSIHGKAGFERLADVIEACDCYDFSYADLNEAVEVFDALKPPS